MVYKAVKQKHFQQMLRNFEHIVCVTVCVSHSTQFMHERKLIKFDNKLATDL